MLFHPQVTVTPCHKDVTVLSQENYIKTNCHILILCFGLEMTKAGHKLYFLLNQKGI